jgi:DNA repair protein REV1
MSQQKTSSHCNLVSLGKTDSQSSDYFDDDDDPGFAEALATLDEHILFGSQPLACLDNVSDDLLDSSAKKSSQGRKRKRSLSPASGQENSQEDVTSSISSAEQTSPAKESTATGNSSKQRIPTIGSGFSTTPLDAYDASKFGGLGDYMRRKRAKLQNQNVDINSQDKRLSQTSLFKPLAIYVGFRFEYFYRARLIPSSRSQDGRTLRFKY